MSSRLRDAQETRNAAEVMGWIRHLADRVEVEVDSISSATSIG